MKKSKHATTKLPMSKAKNAYDLLTDVRKAILEEPKRYDQGVWIQRTKARKPKSIFPACGTIACVAGWVVTLKQGSQFTAAKAEDHAGKILGLDDFTQRDELFTAVPDNFPFGDEAPPVGTRAYAVLGAQHIRLFQRAHRKQLKAKAV